MNLMTFVRQQWDRVGAWVFIAAGALTLLLGYIGISGTPHVAAQLPYLISGGLFGIFLLGIGGLLWISADLRDEWRALWGINDSLKQLLAQQNVTATASTASVLAEAEPIELEVAASVAAAAPAPRPRRRRAPVGEGL
jgi:hypothetical protein